MPTPAIEISNDIYDATRGELFGTVMAHDKESGRPLSGIDYSLYRDEIFIQAVLTAEEFRRQGLATALINHLRGENPGKRLAWPAVTDVGEAFAKAVDPSSAAHLDNINTLFRD
jgi:GNAT superfamily N-acetyltransferase